MFASDSINQQSSILPFRFCNHPFSSFSSTSWPLFPPAIPDDMYNVSPIPDFNDQSKVQQYIQDRRVIGVSQILLWFYRCSLFPVRSSCTTRSSPTWDHVLSQRPENNRLGALQCSAHSSWTWRSNPCRSRSLLYTLPRTGFGICQITQGQIGWLAQPSHHHAGLFVSPSPPFYHLKSFWPPFHPPPPNYSEVDILFSYYFLTIHNLS